MTKIKQNWDHLVDSDGLYGIDIANGIYPGSPNNPGIKGNKGNSGQTIVGPKGAKGRPGANGSDGSKGLQGRKGNTGQKGVKGRKGQTGGNGTDGDKGQKGQTGVTGPKGINGNAGLKGEKGIDGTKGDEGTKGIQGQGFMLVAVVPTVADLPTTGQQVGDLYIVQEDGDGYVWTTQNTWNNVGPIPVGPKGMKGERGFTGDKGEKGQGGEKGNTGNTGLVGNKGEVGDKGINGQKGIDGQKGAKGQKGSDGVKGETGVGTKGQKGVPGIDGTDGAKGDDGQKGTKGTEVDLNNYFTKGEVLALVDPLGPPEDAFSLESYSYPNSQISAGNIDFFDSNQTAAIYNKGMVSVAANVGVSNGPLGAAWQLIVNYVLNDPGDLRGTDYDLVQWVMNAGATGAVDTGNAYFRYVKPASNIFGDWFQASFNPAAYYDRTEVDNLVAQAAGSTYELTTQASGDDAQLILTNQKDNSTDIVTVAGEGGIGVSVAGATITIDGSGVSGTLLFSGAITPPTDPATLEPAPTAGQYFIYDADGTAWNGEAVQQGDWAIYNGDTSAWENLNYQSVDPGVTAVTVSGGLLTLGGTAAEPDIGLDPADVVTPDALDDYVTIESLGNYNSGLTLNGLSDVDVTTSTSGGTATLNTKVAGGALTNGQYSIDTATNTLTFAKIGSNGGNTTPIYNAATPNTSLVRVQNSAVQAAGSASYVTAKTDNGNSFSFTFASPSIIAFLDANNIGIDITVIEYNIDDGNVLTWDNSSKTWVTNSSIPTVTELSQIFLARDGSNSFDAQEMLLRVPDTGARFNLDVNTESGIALTYQRSYMLRATPNNVAVSANFSLNNNSKVNFNGGSGVKLNMPSNNWGSLAYNDTHQFEWGINGMKVHNTLAMNGGGTSYRITNMSDPRDLQDAATRNYVDTQIASNVPSGVALLAATQTFTSTNTFTSKIVSSSPTVLDLTNDGENTISCQAGADCSLRILLDGATSDTKFRVANGSRGVLEVWGDHTIIASDNWNNNLKNGSETRETALVTKGYVDSTGSSYTLPTATTSVLGGVKVTGSLSNLQSVVGISSGVLKIQQSANNKVGVNYKGQACITGSSTPDASQYQQGALILSTSSNAIFIKT